MVRSFCGDAAWGSTESFLKSIKTTDALMYDGLNEGDRRRTRVSMPVENRGLYEVNIDYIIDRTKLGQEDVGSWRAQRKRCLSF